MAHNSTIPEFERGQRLLAADFAALVSAVLELESGGNAALRTTRQGRTFRPFHRAGEAILLDLPDGTTQMRGAEMLWQVGENVTLLPDVPATEVPTPDAELGLMVHAAITWQESGDVGGYTLRAMAHELQATVPDELQESEDGTLAVPYHGAHELAALGAPDARGRKQGAQLPWVQPQRPCLVFRMQGEGQQVILPSPDCTQQLALYIRAFKQDAYEYRFFLARLDKHGMMHMETSRKDYRYEWA